MSKHDDFERHIKSALDDSVDNLSPDIVRKLQQARYNALEKTQSHHAIFRMPAAVMASAIIAVMAIGVWYAIPQSHDTPATLWAMETELELLTSADTLELMEELDFMQWLIETEGYAGQG